MYQKWPKIGQLPFLADLFQNKKSAEKGTTPVGRIAAFNTVEKKWNKVGELNGSRAYHGVIFREGEFIVVGGYRWNFTNLGTERCTFSGKSIHCEHVDPEFTQTDSPHLMTVPDNYCLK